jgi:hypothetical protein
VIFGIGRLNLLILMAGHPSCLASVWVRERPSLVTNLPVKDQVLERLTSL